MNGVSVTKLHFVFLIKKDRFMLKEKIQVLAKQYADEFIAVRHHIHAHPELSYKEFETSKFVQQKLQGWGIPFEVKATTVWWD